MNITTRNSLLKYTFLAITFLCSISISAQENEYNKGTHILNIKKSEVEIKVDGVLDESVWQAAPMADKFWQKSPRVEPNVDPKTEAWTSYDKEYLYVAFKCYENHNNHVAQTLKRDVNFWNSDAISVVIDPANQTTNGYIFGVTVLGVQTEGTIVGGPSFEWNDIWFAETQQYDKYWTAEIAIPFKTLRYDNTSTEWGFNFVRNDMKNNSYHTWTPVPLQFRGVDLNYTGLMKWDEAPPKTKQNIIVIPYTTGSVAKDYEEATATEWKGNIGFDAKLGVTSSLNLDLTVNPDFSQVDVDAQVIDVTRFNIRFPEQRTFFLENSDIFSQFGTPSARPFFSRRIGLDESGNAVPILYGLRLSGNVNENWRIGVMNMQTGSSDEATPQNFSAVAFNRQVFSRSIFRGVFLNKQGLNKEGLQDDYSRNFGGEFTFISDDGNWRSWIGYNQSLKSEIEDFNYSFVAGIRYRSANWRGMVGLTKLTENYYADMGFLRRIENYDAVLDTTFRRGYNDLFTEVSYISRPEVIKNILTHEFILKNTYVAFDENVFNERSTELIYFLRFKGRNDIRLFVNNTEEQLVYPYSFTGETPLPADRYQWSSVGFRYRSDSRKIFSYEVQGDYGSFYNGTKSTISAGITYRKPPFGALGVSIVRNDLDFPEPFGSTDQLLIAPRLEINFSKNLFWTNFFQYNTAADNFNINSRFQWRFRPMSDLFVVYTDNYFLDDFGPKRRSVVIKMNYWLNL